MTPFPEDQFVEAVKRVVADNAEYVPPFGSGGALYIRPLLFGSGPRIGLNPADEYTLLILVIPVGYARARAYIRVFVYLWVCGLCIVGIGGAMAEGGIDTHALRLYTSPSFSSSHSDYYKGGLNPVSALVIDDYDRAAPRGVGHVKVNKNNVGAWTRLARLLSLVEGRQAGRQAASQPPIPHLALS